ncbi:hypothetical protein [Actinoallomurus acaciae]|uniref:WXG100 family type VII secretion target n=1 Tax=Actinoallomurus acaciae TaxID=502577 RepID=A0ABV5Y7V4_9ACTN
MSSKFQFDQTRFNNAIDSIEGLRDLIYEFGDSFYDSLSNAGEVLGHDKDFGLNANQVLQQQRLLFRQATHALGQVADAVPQQLQSQQRYIKTGQQKVLDSVHDVGSHQAEGLPGTGKPGRY